VDLEPEVRGRDITRVTQRRRLRGELLVVFCLLSGACWWGGRAATAVVRTSRPFERANPEEMWFYGLFTLYGSRHAPFLYHVHQVVGRSKVVLWLPGECATTKAVVTTAGWGLVYDLQPATVTCDQADADYLLVFDRPYPGRPGLLVTEDDASHALYRLRR
jgi:hypothetical protein